MLYLIDMENHAFETHMGVDWTNPIVYANTYVAVTGDWTAIADGGELRQAVINYSPETPHYYTVDTNGSLAVAYLVTYYIQPRYNQPYTTWVSTTIWA
jgi:hypothetical protein